MEEGRQHVSKILGRLSPERPKRCLQEAELYLTKPPLPPSPHLLSPPLPPPPPHLTGAEGTINWPPCPGRKGGEELAHCSAAGNDDPAPGDRAHYPHTQASERCVPVLPCTEILGGEDSKPTASEQRRALRHHLERPAHYTEMGQGLALVT